MDSISKKRVDVNDLIGQKFGKLTVTGEAPFKFDSKGNIALQVYCTCDCGTKNVVVSVKNLLSKQRGTKSCGCLYYDKMKASRKDLSGQTFGFLTAIRPAPDRVTPNGRTKTQWYCDCKCGTKDFVTTTISLLHGNTKSCGCLAIATHNSIKYDLTGQTFGDLTVTRLKQLSEYPDGKRKYVEYYCDCSCGTKDFLAVGSELKRGMTTSCGCKKSEHKSDGAAADLTNMRFGLLTAIKKVPKPENVKYGGAWWLCQCDCGNQSIEWASSLLSGHTISCGCVSSKAEEEIASFLTSLNVVFTQQYTFDNCRSPITNVHFRFDFAIFNNQNNLSFLIEYDSELHYPTRKGEENTDAFLKRNLYDSLKTEYCRTNNIDLLRIPYWERGQLTNIITNKLRDKGVI